MKRICQLAFAFFWLTAPVVTFILLRSGAWGGYPFFAALAFIYRFLHRSTNAIFLFSVPAIFTVWILLTSAVFMLGEYPSLRAALCIATMLDLLLALDPAFHWLTAAMDALLLLAALRTGSTLKPIGKSRQIVRNS